VLQLERLDELLRAGFKPGVGMILSDEAREGLGWTAQETDPILRALGYTPTGRARPIAWRRRGETARPEAVKPPPAGSPFAALAGLQVAPPVTPERRRRPRRRKVARP